MSIWSIVILLALLVEEFRNMLFYWLGGLDATALIVLFVLVFNWYYRW
ncbi:hypothetical protein HY572_02295 [Candidatus Micrarchaeota archaeon]|nr:hypothetical protein [Candidatus Micrarchaeota archaeon]